MSRFRATAADVEISADIRKTKSRNEVVRTVDEEPKRGGAKF